MLSDTLSVFVGAFEEVCLCALLSSPPPPVSSLSLPLRHSAAASMPSTLRAARGRHKYQGGEYTVHVHLQLQLQLLRTEGIETEIFLLHAPLPGLRLCPNKALPTQRTRV